MGKSKQRRSGVSPKARTLARSIFPSDAPYSWGVTLCAWIGVCALALLLRYPAADIPLERDEGEYAYIGSRWLLGEVPYQESFDQKPPGVFLVYGLMMRLIGTSPAAIHWGTQIYSLATLAVLFCLGRRLFSFHAGIAAAAFCAAMMADPSVLGNAANTEVFMILPMAASLLAAVRCKELGSVVHGLIAGILGAAAILFKQVALPGLAFCLLIVLLSPGKRWRLGASLLLGALGVVLAVFGYFLAVGAWKGFYDCTMGHNLSYAASLPLWQYPSTFWAGFRKILNAFWPVYLLAGAGLLGPLLPGKQAQSDPLRRNVALAAGWLFFSFLGVAIGGYFREHYFIQILPAVALLAGLGLTRIPLPQVRPVARNALPYLGIAVIIAYGIFVSPWYYLRGSAEERSRRLYGYNPFPESIPVSEFIRRNSSRGERIFVFGSEPQILYYAQRKSASRYIFVYPLMGSFPGTVERQRQVLQELERNQPKFIVTVFVPSSFAASQGAPPDLSRGVQDLLYRSYRIAGAVRYPTAGSWEFVTGEAAAQLWQRAPIWYNTRIWGSMAVWERRDEVG
ncbi:MAG: glycosyltransferase family 39 protein [Acidobacteria bacterium]|nr:glycosyltransferase family 39 protein [Acidobacteriota bacterium]